jgi:ribosome-binding protein aMBF1 (putative translation factor)
VDDCAGLDQVTPEQTAAWIRDRAAATDISVAEYVRQYNAITPEQAKAAVRSVRQKEPSEFGRRLRETRELRGLSLRALEAKCGLSNALISQMETGVTGNPGINTVAKLAKALDVDPGWLAWGDPAGWGDE